MGGCPGGDRNRAHGGLESEPEDTPGSNTGRRLRLKGKGFPGKHPGDLIVVLQVVMPEQHAGQAETLYRQLAEAEKNFNPRSRLHV